MKLIYIITILAIFIIPISVISTANAQSLSERIDHARSIVISEQIEPIGSTQSLSEQIGDTIGGALDEIGESSTTPNDSYSTNFPYNISATSITYLKDGITNDGETTYKVDYSVLQYSDDWPYEKLHVDRVSSTENSNVVVTDSEVITDIVLKIPSKDNPNSYDIDASGGTFKIMNVEMLDNQLNKYNLKFSIVPDDYYLTITPTLTETSPTTAEFKMVTSYE
jgi:hypothetical protein